MWGLRKKSRDQFISEEQIDSWIKNPPAAEFSERTVAYAYIVFKPTLTAVDFSRMLDAIKEPVLMDTLHFGFLVISVNVMPFEGEDRIKYIHEVLDLPSYKANVKAVWGETICQIGNFGNNIRMTYGFRHPDLPKVLELVSRINIGEKIQFNH